MERWVDDPAGAAGSPVQVGLVEDEPRTRERCARVIEAHPSLHLAFAEASVQGAMRALQSHTPQVLLVDLGLPDGHGLDLIHHVGRVHPACQTLVISVFGDDDKVFQCITAGASGYLIKGQGDEDLALHLQDLLEGGSPVSPRIARRLLQAVRQHAPARGQVASPEPPSEALTAREQDILQQLVLGYTYQEVADALGVSVNTVRFHITGIYSKMAVRSRGEAVYEAARRGWVDSPAVPRST